MINFGASTILAVAVLVFPDGPHARGVRVHQWQQLAAVVPARVVGEVDGNLLVRVGQLLLRSQGSATGHEASVVPAVDWCVQGKRTMSVERSFHD